MEALHHVAALAAKYVNSTDQHIFLTGNAGTGKTTFLKYVTQHTFKNTVIAAPTGVAAINAGGVTLHSLLQLPFGLFVPEDIPLGGGQGIDGSKGSRGSHHSALAVQTPAIAPGNGSHAGGFSQIVNTPRTLLGENRFNTHKRKLIRELELLIIDEVSMLRADMLDCIDLTLRHLRRNQKPFGGVQILFIGDLLQLPPVVREEEKQWLKAYYPGYYFFHARALQQKPPIRIELQKVYRQKDEAFVQLLNRFRNDQQTSEDIRQLNRRYQPGNDQAVAAGRICLTTHNHKADRINQMQLRGIDQKEKIYSAAIEGDFPEKMFPVDQHLKLKKDAQVMFIKNDTSGEGAFYNGKIGKVSHLNQQEVFVRLDDGEELLVPRYTWENKRYTLARDTGQLDEKILGSFEQYPLRLAWAVTIHKSQGLTFKKALLDLSQAFSPGQLYVALSRLTSLEGLTLSSPLPDHCPGFDDQLVDFTGSFPGIDKLSEDLEIHRKDFILRSITEAFDFGPALRQLGYHRQQPAWTQELKDDIAPLQKVAARFIEEVKRILQGKEFLSSLADRLEKAGDYFRPRIIEIEKRISTHRRSLKKEKRIKTYQKQLEELESLLQQQTRQMLKLLLFVKAAADNKELNKIALREATQQHMPVPETKSKPSKKDKVPSAEVSFNLFKEGQSIEEIAETRGLVPGTIQAHLCKYVESGKIDVLQILDRQKLQDIMKVYNQGVSSAGELKAALSNDITYGDIRLAQAHARGLGQTERGD